MIKVSAKSNKKGSSMLAHILHVLNLYEYVYSVKFQNKKLTL